MTLLDNRVWGPNNALTVMLAISLMANGETIKRQGCKYFALIIRMIVAVITTCWGTSCYHGQTSLPKRF